MRAQTRSADWMSLADAARALQAAERGSDLDQLSRGLSESDQSLLSFWAHRVARMGVPIYGRRIMSSRSEIIPASEMLAGSLLDQATRLASSQGQPLRDFCALQVRRSDLDACLEQNRQAAAA